MENAFYHGVCNRTYIIIISVILMFTFSAYGIL